MMGASGVGLTTYSYGSMGRLRTIESPYGETTKCEGIDSSRGREHPHGEF